MRTFGRLLQQVALCLPPVSIVLQLLGNLKLNAMLTLLIAAVSMFYIGRIIEGYGRGS
jgi:hypothetical protein